MYVIHTIYVYRRNYIYNIYTNISKILSIICMCDGWHGVRSDGAGRGSTVMQICIGCLLARRWRYSPKSTDSWCL